MTFILYNNTRLDRIFYGYLYHGVFIHVFVYRYACVQCYYVYYNILTRGWHAAVRLVSDDCARVTFEFRPRDRRRRLHAVRRRQSGRAAKRSMFICTLKLSSGFFLKVRLDCIKRHDFVGFCRTLRV